jgi:DNA polymerase-3 subunit delta
MTVMTYGQANKALNRGEIPAFLVLYGEDRFQARELIRFLRMRLEAQSNTGVEYMEWDEEAGDIDIYSSLQTMPLGGGERLVVVNNADLSKVKSYLKVNNSHLKAVFQLEKKLKKKDLPDAKDCWLVECKPLKGRDLNRWLQDEAASRGKELPAAAAEYLRFSCGENAAILSKEIEKAALYLGPKQKKITVGVFQNLGSRTYDRAMFELVDAVAERRGSDALEVINELLAQGKPPVLLVSVVSRHFLQMLEAYWLLEEGLPPRELSGVLGVHPYVAKKLMKQIRSYRLREIEVILEGLLELDLSIKQGRASPDLLITSFLGEFCA